MFGKLPFLIFSKKMSEHSNFTTDRVFYFFISCKNQEAMAGCFLIAFTNRSSTTFLLLPNNGVITDWLLSPDILPLNILSIPLFVINTIARSSFGCCNCISINAKTVMFYQTPVTTINCYKQINRGNLTEELFYCLNWLFNALISATRLITRRL